jgi:RNA polymerase sigma-70 factor (ECF subfamily)
VEVFVDHVTDLGLLRSRHPEAWDAFFERMYARLLGYAERRLGAGEDARDAVSETFTRMVGSVDAIGRRAVNPDAWCFGILHHVVADHHRRAYRARTASLLPNDAAVVPEDQLLLSDEHRQVRDAFDRLSPKDRDLLELRVVGGLSAGEVGEIMKMRPGAVRMAQQRALTRLRSHLDEDDGQ